MSVAEVAIKASLGELRAPHGLDALLGESGFHELALTASHAEALRELPWHHRDPFDRMLVAQAIVEGLDLLTTEPRLHDYPVVCR